jgi:hypothetical protein
MAAPATRRPACWRWWRAGPRTIIDAVSGPVTSGETTYAPDLLRSLCQGMIVPLDRNFAAAALILLALKLTATRRVSHVDDLLDDPASALFAGLAILPKKSALTDYSCRLSHDHQRKFLAALDQQMIRTGLATGSEAIFDLDFHAVMH